MPLIGPKREFELKITGNLAMTRAFFASVGVPPDEGTLGQARSEFSIELVLRTFPLVKVKASLVPGNARDIGWTATVEDGFGGGDIDANVDIKPPTGSYSSSFDDGVYEIRVPCQEFEEIAALADVDADGFPEEPLPDVTDPTWFGGYGSAQKDGLPGRKNRFFLKVKAGADLTVSITGGGASATIVTAIPSAFELEWLATWSMYAGANTNAAAMPFQCVTSGVSYHGFSVTTEYLQTEGGVQFEADGTTFGVTGTAPGDAITREGFGTVQGEPPVSYKMTGLAKCFGDSFPGGTTFKYFRRVQYRASTAAFETKLGAFACSPQASTTWSQRTWTCGCTLNSVSKQGASLAEKTPVRAWVDSEWAATTGDDSRDWRVQFLGRRFDSTRVRHVTPAVLADGSATGWAGSGLTVTSSGGELALSSIGSTSATATRSFSPYSRWEGFRYLRVRIKSTGASKPFTIRVGSQEWVGATGAAGTYANVDLDLLCAGNETANTEIRDTRNPIEDPGGYPTAEKTTVAYSLGWGVNWADSIIVTGLEVGQTYTIDYIELRRVDTNAYLSLLSTFLRSPAAWTSETDTTYLYPFSWQYSDGRPTDWPHMARIDPTGSGADTFRYFSLTEHLGFLDFSLGWEADATVPAFPDSYHTNALEAMHLGGNGATFNYATDEFTERHDILVTATWQTLQAQTLYDQVEGFPECGRGVWDGSAIEPAHPELPIAFTKFKRERSEGAIFREDNIPFRMGRIVASEVTTPANITGTATSDTTGLYRTGLNYARGNRNIRTEARIGPTPYPYLDRLSYERDRSRSSFRRAAPIGTKPWVGKTADGRFMRATLEGGDIWLRLANYITPAGGFESEAQVTDNGQYLSASFAVLLNTQTIFMVAHRDTGSAQTIEYAESNDDGITWSTLTYVANGRYPYVSPDDIGGVLVVWGLPSGAEDGACPLYGRYRGPGDTAFSADFALADSGGSPLIARDKWSFGNPIQFTEGVGRFGLSLVPSGGSAIIRHISHRGLE
jgi:hypothetical protein